MEPTASIIATNVALTALTGGTLLASSRPLLTFLVPALSWGLSLGLLAAPLFR